MQGRCFWGTDMHPLCGSHECQGGGGGGGAAEEMMKCGISLLNICGDHGKRWWLSLRPSKAARSPTDGAVSRGEHATHHSRSSEPHLPTARGQSSRLPAGAAGTPGLPSDKLAVMKLKGSAMAKPSLPFTLPARWPSSAAASRETVFAQNRWSSRPQGRFRCL